MKDYIALQKRREVVFSLIYLNQTILIENIRVVRGYKNIHIERVIAAVCPLYSTKRRVSFALQCYSVKVVKTTCLHSKYSSLQYYLNAKCRYTS